MDNYHEMVLQWYQKPEVRDRIWEYVGNAAYIRGGNPDPNYVEKRYWKVHLGDLLREGWDIHRAVQDEKGLLWIFDLEYGNLRDPSRIFEDPLSTFRRLMPTIRVLERFLRDEHVYHKRQITGQGAHLMTHIGRQTESYDRLLDLGVELKVLPWTAISRIDQIEGKERYRGTQMLQDNIIFAALGRISDFIFEELKGEGELPLRTSDVFGEDEEIAIVDITQHAYLIHRRATRSMYSTHQKHFMYPKYQHGGPPIITLPLVSGISLFDLVGMRQDERHGYSAAAEIARTTSAVPPRGNLLSLIDSYKESDMYAKHRELRNQLEGQRYRDEPDFQADVDRVRRSSCGINEDDISWGLPDQEELKRKLDSQQLTDRSQEILRYPMDNLLRPHQIRHLTHELMDKGFSYPEVIGLIADYYRDPGYDWPADLWKTDEYMRAEHFVRRAILGD